MNQSTVLEPRGTGNRACPDCGAETTNVQGLVACTGCHWTRPE